MTTQSRWNETNLARFAEYLQNDSRFSFGLQPFLAYYADEETLVITVCDARRIIIALGEPTGLGGYTARPPDLQS